MSKQLQDADKAKNKDEQNKDADNTNGVTTDSENENAGEGNHGDGGDGNSADNANDADKDLGFPKDTPVAEMDDKQAREYWKHQSRKHEDAKKDLKKVLGDLTAEDLSELKEAKTKYDALLASSSQSETDHAQALADAKAEGAAEERAKYAPTLLDLEIRALLGDRYDADRLKTILARTNTDGFFTDEGSVNADAVKEYFNVLFTAPAGSTKTPRSTHGGHGSGDGTPSTGSAGKSLYQEMKQKNRGF